MELRNGTRAGTRSLMSDFILVCPFQNSSSVFLSYVQVIPSVLWKAYPFLSYLKCTIYKGIFCCPWCFLHTSAQSSWESFCRLVSFTITPYRKSWKCFAMPTKICMTDHLTLWDKWMKNTTDSKKQINNALTCDFYMHSFGGFCHFGIFIKKNLNSFWVTLVGNTLL